MTTAQTDPTDPLTDAHSSPTAAEQLQQSGRQATEAVKDHVWPVVAGAFLFGILAGAAACQASCNHQKTSTLDRILGDVKRNARRASRQIQARLPMPQPPEPTICERLKFW